MYPAAGCRGYHEPVGISIAFTIKYQFLPVCRVPILPGFGILPLYNCTLYPEVPGVHQVGIPTCVLFVPGVVQGYRYRIALGIPTRGLGKEPMPTFYNWLGPGAIVCRYLEMRKVWFSEC